MPNPSKEQLIDVVQRHFMSQVLEKLDNSCMVFLQLFPRDLLRIRCFLEKKMVGKYI